MGRITEKKLTRFKKSLHSSADELKKEMMEYLSDLISCDTTNPPGNEYICKETIMKMMNELGMKVITKEKVKGRTNFIGSIGLGKPVVVFAGHLDTVPAGDNWTKTKPFVPKIEGSCVYGRGAEDNKGGLVTSWAGIKLFLEKYPKFIGIIQLLAVADEEMGSINGMKYLIEDGYKADYALVPDGGPMSELIIGEKGILWVRITSFGKQAHASTPHRGVNAIENLNELLSELKTIDWGESTSKEFKPTTYNLGVIKGGNAPNIVPGEAMAEVDFRRPIGVSKVQIMAKIKKVAAKVQKINSQARFSFKILEDTNPHLVNRDNLVVKAFLSAARELKTPVGIKTMGGNTYGKLFNEAGISAIVHHPTTIENAHMTDEHVDINDLYQGARLYAAFLEKLLIK